VGSCFGQWHMMDPDEPLIGFRSRIVPACTAALVGAYCMEWLQPSEHHDLPAALQLQAVYMGGFMLTIFFVFGRMGIRFPLLSSFGKNLLLMFTVGGLGVGVYWGVLPKPLLIQYPLLALILGWLAVLLDKRGVMVRA
jgi:hypothetical protein